MTETARPALEVTIAGPRNVADVVKWAQLAEDLGVPASSTVQLETIGRKAITVRAWLDQTTAAER